MRSSAADKCHNWNVRLLAELCAIWSLRGLLRPNRTVMQHWNLRQPIRRPSTDEPWPIKASRWTELLYLCVTKGSWFGKWHWLNTLCLCPSNRTIWPAALTCRRCCSRIPMCRKPRKSWRRSRCCLDRVSPTHHRPSPERLFPSQR